VVAITLAAIVAVPLLAAASAALATRMLVAGIEAAHPPAGRFVQASGRRFHVVDLPAAAGSGAPSADAAGAAEPPAIVFLHGAVATLVDPLTAFRPTLEGRARLVFLDRPGHGYSERGGPEDADPIVQSDAIAAALAAIGVSRAIIVGHSFGGAVAAAFAVRHPDLTAGLVLLAPATHPWPGGVSWSYDLVGAPVIGGLVSETITTPLGLALLPSGFAGVFAPETPPDGLIEETAAKLALRPQAFRASAEDIRGLKARLTAFAPRYAEIAAPTVVLAGDSDRVVSTDIHARALVAAVRGARLVVLPGAGHALQHTRTDVIVAEIERMLAEITGSPPTRSANGATPGTARIAAGAALD
jgi:pimeloyl-ACP methyl ester carboxylesterase